jgi:two-component system LytT family sensor kinase
MSYRPIFIASFNFIKTFQLYRLAAILILLLLPVLVPAQYNIAFHHITTLNGLSDNDVSNAAIDKNGFLWICTSEGLNRYDGREMKNYFKENVPALRHNNIREVLCDKKNRLWVRSFGGYISMLDEKRKWHAIQVKEGNDVVPLYNIVETRSKGIVLFNGKRQYVLNSDDSSFNRWHFNGDSVFDQRLYYYSHITADKIIWTGTDELFIMDYATNKISFRKKVPGITSAVAFNRNELYITTSASGGLYKLDMFTGELTSLSQLKDQYGITIFSSLQMVRKMADNRLIITTAFAGLYVYDPSTNKLYHFVHDPLNNRSVSSNNYLNLIADSSGYVLIASPTSGLSYFNVRDKPATWISAVSNQDGDIFDGYVNAILAADAADVFWLGCYNQLIKWDKKTGKALFFDYGKSSNNYPNKGNDEVVAMCKDKLGRLWIGTGNNGIVVLEPNGKLVTQINEPNGNLPSNSIHYLFSDDGKMFISTDRGICAVDANSYKLLPLQDSALHVLDNKFIGRLWKDSKQRLWIGTLREGAYCYDAVAGKLTNIARPKDGISMQVFAFEEDADGKIYLGTSSGLLVLQQDTVLAAYTRLNGLKGDRCENILKDAAGNLWLDNHNCIIRFDPTHKTFSVFDEKSGLSPLGFRPGSSYKDANGFFYVGCEKGFNFFHPGAITEPQALLKLSVNSIQTAHEEFAITGPQSLALQYDDNSVVFHLTVIDLEQSKNILYRYRLNGFDEKWITETNVTNVRYNGLAPGNYDLEVEASADGVKWIKALYPLSVVIQPAFWQAGWFRFAAALGLAIVFYFALKLRENSIQDKAHEKARIEEMRSQALQYQLEIEQVINYFANSLSGLHSVDDILWDVVRTCISQLGFQDCVIYFYNSDKTMLLQKAAYGPKNIDYTDIYNRIEIAPGSGIVGHVALTGLAEIINDTSKDIRYIPDDAVRLSEIAVPIVGGNGVIGAIDSEHPEANFYTYRHLQILTAIAAMVANKTEQLEAEADSRKKEVEMARLQRDVATLQLTATRAQMNPHFIFNALNSIQQYILQGDTDEANKYLSRFSRLQREILNHCDKPFISLKKEIDMLRMYLQLEQLRFNGAFDFTISADEDLDEEEIKIPPMILQPFVENAIWHGLMPKTGNREVIVNFTMDEVTAILHCTISDNGIGRQAAADRKNKGVPQGDYVSKGLSLVYQRLQLLQEQMGRSFTSGIKDVVDADGNVAGTKVEVTMFTGF